MINTIGNYFIGVLKLIIFKGDLLEQITNIEDNSVDLVLTSPPYAEQRDGLYNGINEHDYPEWTVKWMQQVKRILKPAGNVAIVIRPHIKEGQISDYTLKMRLAIREDGWRECEELIWIKPTSAPLGSNYRPRRSWESIHWFSLDQRSYCDPKANGVVSDRIGMESVKGVNEYIDSVSTAKSGIARCKDYVEVGTHESNKDKFNTHPAQYPENLASWLIKLLSPEQGVVLDPFMGSGTTGVACLKNNRSFIGIDLEEKYIEIAEKRMENIQKNPAFKIFT